VKEGATITFTLVNARSSLSDGLQRRSGREAHVREGLLGTDHPDTGSGTLLPALHDFLLVTPGNIVKKDMTTWQEPITHDG
jgi:hypothetical protein